MWYRWQQLLAPVMALRHPLRRPRLRPLRHPRNLRPLAPRPATVTAARAIPIPIKFVSLVASNGFEMIRTSFKRRGLRVSFHVLILSRPAMRVLCFLFMATTSMLDVSIL